MIKLFALALLVLPFNGVASRLSILGELSSEAAIYPVLLLVCLYGVVALLGKKIHRPSHISVAILFYFVGWILLSGIVNTPTIMENFTKGRSGFEKYLLQVILFIFMLFASFSVYHAIQEQKIEQTFFIFRRWVLYSFLVAGVYSLIEISYMLFNAGWASSLLESIDPIFHSGQWSSVSIGRLRSVSGEPSWFAMYMAFALPWLMSYIFTEKHKKWLFFCLNTYAFFMVFLTYSRTAYVITLAEVIGLVIATRVFEKWQIRKYSFIIAIGLIMATISYMIVIELAYERLTEIVASLITPESKTTYYSSNVARFGSQAAAWKMAFHQPIFGMGLGQYGFHMSDYISSDAIISSEIRIWLSSLIGTPWPPVHSLYARIAAETGYIGLGLWVFMWLTLLRSIWQRIRLSSEKDKIMGMILLVSICGTLLVGFNMDTFRFFGYWFLLALGWKYVSYNSISLNLNKY